jgi:hypothetical protein
MQIRDAAAALAPARACAADVVQQVLRATSAVSS